MTNKNLLVQEKAELDVSVQNQTYLLVKSAAGARYLIILQVVSRALTFAINQLLLRFVSPELLGISTQLEVYSLSILFFSREALRVAFQRQTDTPEADSNAQKREHKGEAAAAERAAARNTQGIVNMAYVSVILGIGFSLGLRWIYIRSLQSNVVLREAPHFGGALQLYTIAATVELLAEPSFAVVMQKSEYKIRATAESIATVVRCVSICCTAIAAHHRGWELGVLPFAFGQLGYALSLLLVYVGNVWYISARSGFSILPRKIENRADFVLGYFSRPVLSLGSSLFLQSILKHFLTQGDVLLISYLASLQDQGVYALASNYGGLIARMIFQPIEESSRNYFGKQLSSTHQRPGAKDVSIASKHLHQMLRIYALLSLSAVAIGPVTAPVLLSIVAGSKWTASGAGNVLGKYCYYIPLLAINGVTEAFISAVATKSELNRQSAYMVAFSIGFGTAGYFFLKVLQLGAEGLVWANVINMSLRILWGFHFTGRYLTSKDAKLDLGSLTPRPLTLAVGVVTSAVLHQISGKLTGDLWDVARVGPVAGIYVIAIILSERQYLIQLWTSVRGR